MFYLLNQHLYNFSKLDGTNQSEVINILQNKIIDFIFQETVEGKIGEYFNFQIQHSFL